MGILAPVLEYIALGINLLSIFVLVWGVARCAINFIKSLLPKKTTATAQHQIMQAKIELGRYVLLGLEILIVADIIETIINPTVEDIFKLAAIVAIRTVISFFLNREIKETNQELSDSK